jgi:hypothetical protein
MTCSLCEKPVLAKGLCSKHYTRLRNHGSPDVVLSPRGEAQRFISELRPQAECVPWPFKATYGSGYGAVTFGGKLTGAHRAVCEINHGPPPSPKHEAAHSCGNKACVNPAHLRWATPKENAADKAFHGTAPIGEANGCAKLTTQQVAQIRNLKGTATQTAIAQRFGVSRRAIGMIFSNQTWKAV